MNLLIVESPAKCKKIQSFLGKDFIVKSSYGHFRDLEKKKLGIDIENNFTPKYILLDDKKNVISDLKSAFKKCKNLYLAADNDREGEAIAWHLNETLNKGKNTSKRILFNEITKTALVNAVNNPGEINMNMFYAQQARRIIDRLVGFLISPMLWKNVQSNYKKGEGLSAGRVQSVVNKLIIERENSINSFQKNNYFNLTGFLKYENDKIPIKYIKTKDLKKYDDLKAIFLAVKKYPFIVKNIKNKKKKENAKAPFTTSTLQQEAHNKLSMSSKQTMMVAQKLYENGFITYMRTDSTIISEDALKEIKSQVIELYGEKYYKKNTFKTKTKNAQEAHECCRVTDIKMNKLKESMGPDEKRLYDLIWKRTIASQMATMIKDVLDVEISLDKYIFQSIYEKIDFDGYMIVYNVKKDSKNESLLQLKENSLLKFISFSAEEKFTTPESRFNDSSLVKKLEELGIGRPSTFSNMVNSVLDKNYAVIKDNPGETIEITNYTLEGEKIDLPLKKIKKSEENDLSLLNYNEIKSETHYGSDKGKINPTQIGIIVNDYLDKYFTEVINYEFTAFMEKQLDLVSAGENTWNDIVLNVYKKIKLSIDNSPTTSIKNDYSKILGNNEKNNSTISVYIGQYGPVLKEEFNDPTIKPKFVSIKDLNIDSVTIESALELLKYPYIIGTYKDTDIYIANGQYGKYIKYGGKNYSFKIEDESNIDLDNIIQCINEKTDSGPIKKINDKISIMNGKYGPYIKYSTKNKSSNYKIIFDKSLKTDKEKKDFLNNITLKDCENIMSLKKTKKTKK